MRAALVVIAASGCVAGNLRGQAAVVVGPGEIGAEIGFVTTIGYAPTEHSGVGFRAEGVLGTELTGASRLGLEYRHLGAPVGMHAAGVAQVGVSDPVHGAWAEGGASVPVRSRFTVRPAVRDRARNLDSADLRRWDLGLLGRVGGIRRADGWHVRAALGASFGWSAVSRLRTLPSLPRP